MKSVRVSHAYGLIAHQFMAFLLVIAPMRYLAVQLIVQGLTVVQIQVLALVPFIVLMVGATPAGLAFALGMRVAISRSFIIAPIVSLITTQAIVTAVQMKVAMHLARTETR